MDARLVADFDATYANVRELRSTTRAEPELPGQRGAIKANPAFVVLASAQSHLRGLASLIGPERVVGELRDEFNATMRDVRKLREPVMAEPVVPGQRGTYAKHPLTTPLNQQQIHLRGLAALLLEAKADVPIPDGELEALLD